LAREFGNIAHNAHQASVRLVEEPAPVRPAPVPEPPAAATFVPAAIEPPPVFAPVPEPAPTPVPAPAAAVAPVAEGGTGNDIVQEQLDPELLEIFLEEAVDILAAIEESLTRWRSNRTDKAAISELKRQLHTLKGGARMSGAMTMGNLGHQTESLLGEIELGRAHADGELMDLMDEVHDALVTMVDQMQNRRPVHAFTPLTNKVLVRLGQAPLPVRAPEAPPAPAAPVIEAPAVIEAPRVVETAKASPVAAAPPPAVVPMVAAPVHAPEVVPPALAAAASTPEPDLLAPHIERRGEPEEAEGVAGLDRRGQIKVRTGLLNELVNFAGEVSISRARMEQQIFGLRENLAELNRNTTRFRDQIRELEIQSESQMLARAQAEASRVGDEFDPLELDRFSRLQTLSRSLAESLHDLFTIRANLENYASLAETVLQQQARINTDLQEGLMRTRMIGFGTQAARLRHIVRQTAREVGKRVELDLVGAEVEVDRTVLERMIGPFEHMIRNAIDHGLEAEAERKRAGKPATGKISITTANEGSEVVIRFADDGAGLDIAAIRRKAIERGLMKASANLSDDELIQFILMPGFSTAGQVTQLSGRGVGMDVVHSEVKQLGGSITVDTRRGQGTTFIIRLPLTLSIAQALMVRAGEQLFSIPISAVINILEVPVEDLHSIHVGRRPLLNWQDQVYPFMNLAVRLGINPQPATARKVPVLLARSGGRQVAIQVDGLAGTREIVIKPLGQQLSGIEGLAGATILGDGSVVLILDVPGLWLTEEGLQVAHEAPVVGAEAVIEPVIEEPVSAAPLRDRAVVMVVDDSITVRKVTQRHLSKRGVDVLLAKDGVDAMEQLREQVPDVMLVDIEMPRMDGYELTQHVRSDSRLKQVPIIMITSRAGEKHREKALALGVNVYMTKPYQEDDLLDKINSLLPPHLVAS
jgi:chemosensory pili system protein ChpA (sensor histidine kinase/response regulator)